jgi:hypothetical protein
MVRRGLEDIFCIFGGTVTISADYTVDVEEKDLERRGYLIYHSHLPPVINLFRT